MATNEKHCGKKTRHTPHWWNIGRDKGKKAWVWCNGAHPLKIQGV